MPPKMPTTSLGPLACEMASRATERRLEGPACQWSPTSAAVQPRTSRNQQALEGCLHDIFLYFQALRCRTPNSPLSPVSCGPLQAALKGPTLRLSQHEDEMRRRPHGNHLASRAKALKSGIDPLVANVMKRSSSKTCQKWMTTALCSPWLLADSEGAAAAGCSAPPPHWMQIRMVSSPMSSE